MSPPPDDAAAIEEAWEHRKAALCQAPTLLSAASVLRAAQLRPPFAVTERIPLGAITFIAGPPGSAKSWLAYDLVLAVVQGRPWLDCELGADLPPTPSALILNYDNPTGELGRRLMRLGMRPTDPIWFHSPDAHALRLPDAIDDLRAIVEAKDPAIVLIDSFRQANTGDENSSKEMAAVMGCCKVLARRGAAVVIVHHTSKNVEASGQARTRGSVEITASADAVAIVNDSPVERDGPRTARLEWDKHRSWRLEPIDRAIPFVVVDRGETTVVVATG